MDEALLGFHGSEVGYRQVQGIVRALSKRVKRLKAPDYTSLWERGSRLRPSIDEAIGDAASRSLLRALPRTGSSYQARFFLRSLVLAYGAWTDGAPWYAEAGPRASKVQVL
ncbi:MAG: hypothetical protein QXM16_06570 [Nitrososphaerota archaeon]